MKETPHAVFSPRVRRRWSDPEASPAGRTDPLRSLAAAARVVRGGTAGAVLYPDEASGPLPGLEEAALLADGSPVAAIARSYLESGHLFGSFLWPGDGQPDEHVRVTVMAGPEDPPGPLGVVILSAVTQRRGLTPRELEVLGLLVDGCCNQQIAHALVVAERTVATHVEHILAKFGVATRTLAAVRAEREGLYVPRRPQPCPA